jgi:hypothetical protein
MMNSKPTASDKNPKPSLDGPVPVEQLQPLAAVAGPVVDLASKPAASGPADACPDASAVNETGPSAALAAVSRAGMEMASAVGRTAASAAIVERSG